MFKEMGDNNYTNTNRSLRRDIVLGAIIGDYVGSRFEFNNHKSKEFDLFHHDCKFTDDTAMTIAVFLALKQSHGCVDLDTFVSDMLALVGRSYPNMGYGGMFRKWIASDDRKPYNSYGNGSAMRVSPAAYFANSLDEAVKLANISAGVTHNHPEGIKGAEVVSRLCYLASSGFDKRFLDKEARAYYDLNFTLDSIRESYKFDETCQGTVPQAIVAFLESIDYEDAIRNAISIGGDSDTLACITGSIAGAYYGIPTDLVGHIEKELRSNHRVLYRIISELFS